MRDAGAPSRVFSDMAPFATPRPPIDRHPRYDTVAWHQQSLTIALRFAWSATFSGQTHRARRVSRGYPPVRELRYA